MQRVLEASPGTDGGLIATGTAEDGSLGTE